MPVVKTKGAASAQGFGEFAKTGVANYIEEVFSTWLYTGTGSAQTFTNGVNLSANGGLVWVKSRSVTGNNWTQDTTRGINSVLYTNLTNAAGNPAGTAVTTFNTTGFSIGTNTNINNSGDTYVSWTFAERQKFFDIVTYTGNGGTLSVDQALGSKPGCIMIKKTSSAGDWLVCTRKSDGNIYAMYLNTTAGQFYDGTEGSLWNSTSVSINWINSNVAAGFNDSGATYVMYLFAHNAGGFGLTGSDNVITCGSYTGGTFNGVTYDAVTTTLGFEPQWLLIKEATGTNAWFIFDNMRGIATGGNDPRLSPNSSNQEFSSNWVDLTSTGFTATASDGSSGINNGSSYTYIYIAIRRGPMKVPTTGTSVFSPNSTSGTTGTPITTGFPVDWQLLGINAGNALNQRSSTRLTGVNTNGSSNSQYLATSSTNAEAATASVTLNWGNTGFQVPSVNSGNPIITWNFQRAPGFFDGVCYTGNGSTQNQSHNLAAVPELMIVKARSLDFRSWAVYFGNNGTAMSLNNTTASRSFAGWNYTTPTTSLFSLGADSDVNSSGYTYVAYLFATCPGVSKVGSYTGTAALLTVNCGFAAGARFVLIKRTDSTGDWYVYDSARGISSGNDPYLLLNSTAAETTGTNYVDTDTTGFKVTAAAPAGLNANGGTYIFLAIA